MWCDAGPVRTPHLEFWRSFPGLLFYQSLSTNIIFYILYYTKQPIKYIMVCNKFEPKTKSTRPNFWSWSFFKKPVLAQTKCPRCLGRKLAAAAAVVYLSQSVFVYATSAVPFATRLTSGTFFAALSAKGLTIYTRSVLNSTALWCVVAGFVAKNLFKKVYLSKIFCRP